MTERRPKPPLADGREVVVARCHGWIDDSEGVRHLDHVRIGWMEGTTVALPTGPHGFWPYAIRSGSTLLVLGSADRDMSLLGEPPGWERRWRVRLPKTGAPSLYRSIYRHGKRRLEVVQVGNWHPIGHRCGDLSFAEVIDFVRATVS